MSSIWNRLTRNGEAKAEQADGLVLRKRPANGVAAGDQAALKLAVANGAPAETGWHDTNSQPLQPSSGLMLRPLSVAHPHVRPVPPPLPGQAAGAPRFEHASAGAPHTQSPRRPSPVRAAPRVQRRFTETINGINVLREALPEWKGECFAGVVVADMSKSLAILWLGLGDVALAGTSDALASGYVSTVRARLEGDLHLNVVTQVPVSPQLLSEVTQAASGPNSRVPRVIGKDNYHLIIFDEIIAAAVRGRASDIHFSLRKATSDASRGAQDGALIALRMFGRYRPWRTEMSATLVRAVLGSAFGIRLISKTNSKSDLHFDNDVSFMTDNTVDGVKWLGRCNGRPDVRGYKMVIRLLEHEPNADAIPTLGQLGYVTSHCGILERAVLRNYGVIIIFGSTGSGKSTTLRTFMVRVTDPQALAAYSVESPVEYDMPGVAQFSIPVDVNMTNEEMAAKFLAALRDVLRMDPDVLMVGEIRDHESAVLMSEFTQSGHRCYTTAHGDSAVDGLSRICGEQIQLPAELLAGARFLSASIYQRLLPTLCPHCKLPANDEKHGLAKESLDLLRRKFSLDPGTMYVARPGGCIECQPAVPGLHADGTKGVTVAAEVLEPNNRMRELAAKRDWAGLHRAWRQTRRSGFGDGDMVGKTAYECALYLASRGLVSIVDIEREFEPLESYEIFPTDSEALRGITP